jgi:hypothetical protein
VFHSRVLLFVLGCCIGLAMPAEAREWSQAGWSEGEFVWADAGLFRIRIDGDLVMERSIGLEDDTDGQWVSPTPVEPLSFSALKSRY